MILAAVLATEALKLRHSRTVWFSLTALSMGPLGIALLVWIVREPDRAAQFGLLGTKAGIVGVAADWPSYLALAGQMVGGAGLIAVPFLVAYVFGREYADGTAKNMLALPVRRDWFVIAKLVVVAAWWLLLIAWAALETLVIGLALGLPGLSGSVLAAAARQSLTVAGFAYSLAPIAAWITCLGRGYLAPLAFALVMLLLGNVLSKTGWGVWFPWSVIPRLIGTVGTPVATIPSQSLVVLGAAFIAGLLATLLQVRRADIHQ